MTPPALLLGLGEDGTGRLCVDPRCVNALQEFGAYAYATTAPGEASRRDSSEGPVKQSDHLMDALRYALSSEFSVSGRADAYLDALTQRYEAEMGTTEGAAAGESAEEVMFRGFTRERRKLFARTSGGRLSGSDARNWCHARRFVFFNSLATEVTTSSIFHLNISLTK